MRPFGDRFLRTGTPRSFTEVENSARIGGLGFAHLESWPQRSIPAASFTGPTWSPSSCLTLGP